MKKSSAVFFAALLLLFTAALGGFFALYFAEKATLQEQSSTEAAEKNRASQGEKDVIVDVWQRLSPAVVGVTGILSQGEATTEEMNVGSGVILDSRGYIITNYHVIHNVTAIYVTLSDNSSHRGEVVGTDARTDLAMLKIEGSDYPVAALGNSDVLQVGEQAIAIGNPGGMDFAGSVTTGIISGLNRPLTTDEGLRFQLIQTDAAINPGNSGGALANAQGEVVGINTIKISEEGFEGMGFALPSNLVGEIAAALMDQGKVVRAALGVYLLGAVGKEYYIEGSDGADYGVVISPRRGGTGEKAGLQENDIVIAVDGVKVSDVYALQEMIFDHEVGDTVDITIRRSGVESTVSVTLEALEEE